MSVRTAFEIRRIKTQVFQTKTEKNYSKEETQMDSEEELSNNSSPTNKDQIKLFPSFDKDIQNHVNNNFRQNFPIIRKFVNLLDFVDFDSEEKKDLQNIVNIINNKEVSLSSDILDQDKTLSFSKYNKKSQIDNTPIEVLL